MNQTETNRLMNAVLDGEATAEQNRVLETLLGADPALRVQFEELRNMMAMLGRVPAMQPPEDLVD